MTELLYMICSYLPPSDIIALRCTCQALCELLQEALWKDVDARCFRTLTNGRQTGNSPDSFVRHRLSVVNNCDTHRGFRSLIETRQTSNG